MYTLKNIVNLKIQEIKMNAKKAMELLLQGKKVKRADWCKDLYVKLDENGDIVNQNNEYFFITFNVEDSWEEYIETVEISKVITHISNGGKAQRLNQDNQLTTVFLNEDGYLMRETIIHNRTTIDLLHKDDLTATNWNLI